jgi:P-type conjugative transfer protein TrbJ
MFSLLLLDRSPAFRRVAVALVVAVLIPTAASAQLLGSGIVFDPSNFARNVLHYTRRLEQMDLQRQQLQQQLNAMRKLSNPPWRDISRTVAQLTTLMSDGRALSYQIANLDQAFRQAFPVTRSFADWPAERRSQAERTVATMANVLSGARAQAQLFNDGLRRLDQMKSQVSTVQGHEAALELQSSATVFNGEELMMLRQALVSQTSMQAVYYADQVNKESQQASTIDDHLAGLSVPATRSRSISLRITPP